MVDKKRFYIITNNKKSLIEIDGLDANTGPCNHCWGCVAIG